MTILAQSSDDQPPGDQPTGAVSPRVQVQRTEARGRALLRDEVFVDGASVGAIVYTGRRENGATRYGWRPEHGACLGPLTGWAEAVRQLEVAATST